MVIADQSTNATSVTKSAAGTWLLTGQPVAMPDTNVTELIRQRRRLVPNAAEPVEDPGDMAVLAEPSERLAVLRSSLEAALCVSRI